MAWHSLVRSISGEPRDPGVARLKLDWWREELARLRHREARHPVAARLQRQPGFDARAIEPMHTILDATEAEIQQPVLSSDQAFFAVAQRTGGALFEALAMQENPTIERDPVKHQGTYCEIVDRIRLNRQHPQRLPSDIAATMEDRRELPRFARRCAQILDSLADDLPPRSPDRPPSTTDRLVALHRAMHAKMQRLHYPVDRPAIDRSPIANLWTAWRCR